VKNKDIIVKLLKENYGLRERVRTQYDNIAALQNVYTEQQDDLNTAYAESEVLRGKLRETMEKLESLTESVNTQQAWHDAVPKLVPAPEPAKVKHMTTTRKRTGNTSWKQIINRLLEEPAGTKVHVHNPPVRSAINTAVRKYQLQHEYKGGDLYVWYPSDRVPDSEADGV
jgi:hypothetical protein